MDAARAQSFSPARLLELHGDEDAVCPKVPELVCQVVVDETGVARTGQGTFCFGNPGEDEQRARVLNARMVHSSFEPARIDGEPVSVYASFRVFFQPRGGSCDVSVAPYLYAREPANRSFSAPQEIVTGGSWLDRLPRNVRLTKHGRSTWTVGVAFVMSVAVDERGRASDGRVERNNSAPDDTLTLSVKALEQSRFVPAFENGQPISARYYELMYLNPSGEPLTGTRAQRH
jgi:hypothetical protein